MRKRNVLGFAFCLWSILLTTTKDAVLAAEEDSFGSVTAQVNSVSELTDVDPSSWAFQSLKAIVERFGYLEGYPSKAFLGNQSLTRYEFAAGLNACLEKVAEQIAAGTASKATKADLLTLQRLQEDFSSELATLRTRVDALELQTKSLESHLFSTTAKLDGSVVMAITGGGASANVRPNDFSNNSLSFPGNGANTTFVARTSLNIRATLSGTDELLIRLRGVTGQDISSSFPGIAGQQGTLFYAGSPVNFNNSFSYDASALSPVGTNGSASVSFDKVRYSTDLFDGKLRVYIGSRIDLFEFIDTNSFANNEEVDFSNGFLIHNTLITSPAFAGSGLGFDWEITPNLNLRGAYIPANGGGVSSFGSGGVTGRNNNIVGEIELRPSPSSSIRLQYSHSTVDSNEITIIPLGFGEKPLSSDGIQGGFFFGSMPLPQTQSDAVGLNAEWAITPDIAIFGRFAFGWSNSIATNAFALTTTIVSNGMTSVSSTFSNVSTTTYSETNSWSAGLTFPRLFNSLGTLGISVGQVPRASLIQTSNGSASDPLNLAISSGRETDLEVFYRLPIGDRITITPDLQMIFDPLNVAGNPIITIGTLRAVFDF